MSSDLISRQAAIDAISCDITVTGRQNAELVAATIGTFADRIKALPSAEDELTIAYAHGYTDAEAEFHLGRQVGKWRLHKGGSGTCSKCRHTQIAIWDADNWQNFCGVCGARMVGVEI